MKNLLKYFSTAPVLLTLWLSITSTLVFVINYYYPNSLTFPTF